MRRSTFKPRGWRFWRGASVTVADLIGANVWDVAGTDDARHVGVAQHVAHLLANALDAVGCGSWWFATSPSDKPGIVAFQANTSSHESLARTATLLCPS